MSGTPVSHTHIGHTQALRWMLAVSDPTGTRDAQPFALRWAGKCIVLSRFCLCVCTAITDAVFLLQFTLRL